MSIDILTVNAVLGKNIELQSEYENTLNTLMSAQPEDSPGRMCFVPLMEGGTSFKVCGTCWANSGYSGAKMIGGSNCTWTVPSGVTEVEFQIWGAGASSGSACCCGGGPFGATGAYVYAKIPTTPGNTYTICSGGVTGSRTEFCCSQYGACGGDTSYVTGTNLSGVCAEGGSAHLNCSMCDLPEMRSGPFYRYSATDSGGNCMCDSCTWYCGASCASCGIIPIHKSSGKLGQGTVSGTDSVIHKIPSWWSGGYWDNNLYGYHIAAPVVKEDHTIFYGSCMKHTFTSESCTGGGNGSTTSSCCGLWNTHPGMGGSSSHTMGGANNMKGDLGRMGMVKVTYK